MGKIKEWFGKIKNVKNIEIIIAVIICLIVLLLFISAVTGGTGKKETGENYSFYEYVESIENKLVNVIGSVKGAGKVTVAINFVSGTEKVYAYETQIQTSGGITTEKKVLVTLNGEPVVVKELAPDILGVIVSAGGAGNPVVRMQIFQAVKTLLGVGSEKIQVFTSN